MTFNTLNFGHRKTLTRIKLVIQTAEKNPTLSRFDLDKLCGQPNTETNRILRSVFIRKPEVVNTKNGEYIEYVTFQPALAELKAELARRETQPEPTDWFADFDTLSTPILRLRAAIMRKNSVDADTVYAFEHRLSNRLFQEQQKQVSIFG
jgi:type IV secretory pathway ATPase VirB11/archaellum biosynthesis ATPase